MKNTLFLFVGLALFPAVSLSAGPEPTRSQLVAAASSFAAKLSIPLRDSSAQVRTLKAGALWTVTLPDIHYIVGPDLSVWAVNFGGYGTARRKILRKEPFATSDKDWFRHGLQLVSRVWPELSLTNKSREDFRPNDTQMLWSDARTVRLIYAISKPSFWAGGQVTLILDRDQGKPISMDRMPFRGRSPSSHGATTTLPRIKH